MNYKKKHVGYGSCMQHRIYIPPPPKKKCIDTGLSTFRNYFEGDCGGGGGRVVSTKNKFTQHSITCNVWSKKKGKGFEILHKRVT